MVKPPKENIRITRKQRFEELMNFDVQDKWKLIEENI